MRTVFQEWGSYNTSVVPADAGALQREECRRAFYAGAWAIYLLMLEASSDPDEEQCERNLSALHSELSETPRDLALAPRHP